jgi:ribosomal protein S18 acetylase RimI-like enzyme
MEIRQARPEDVPDLVELWLEFMDFHSVLDQDYVRSSDAIENWTKYITDKIADKGFRVFVAVDQESLVGQIVATLREYPPVFTIKRYGFIQEIAIHDGFRRQGIASLLYDAAEDWLIAAGVCRIQTNVDSQNEASRSFWKSAGFGPHTETMIKRFGRTNTGPA